MISKKYLILNKAQEDFARRIEQGENIDFNFSCNWSNKRRKVSDKLYVQTTTRQQQDDDDDSTQSSSSEYEEEVITTVKKTSSTRRATTRKSQQQQQSNQPQSECCIIGCENGVTNRLRFSLRCHKEEDFKPEFLEQGHNKVCHYHYFADLYKFKKMNKSTSSSKKKAASTTSTKKTKRTRDEFESKSSSIDTIPCKAVTPNTRMDASVFFSFVGGLNGGSKITKAL